jgi:hypothetical protein
MLGILILLASLAATVAGPVPVQAGALPGVETGGNSLLAKDNGKHKEKDKDKDKDKGKGKKNGHDNGKHQGQQKQIAEADAYAVEVECQFDDRANQTTCVFTGVAPEDGKDVNHIDLPEEAVCADVVGGDYDYVDPDPNTHVTGYQSRGHEGAFTLVLAGQVTTSGATTYWFKVGGGIFPAQGPGLACETTGKAASQLETPPASTPDVAEDVPDTGQLTVTTYLCGETPVDPATFDWYGACDQGGSYNFTLAVVESGPATTYTVDASKPGVTTFGSLAPGVYHLELPGAKWCHAESDDVNADGDLNISAGETTQVWIFLCADSTGS